MRISQLDGRRVALWGWGREGRAAYRAIRARAPGLPLTLVCLPDEAVDAVAIGDPLLDVQCDVTGGFARFEVVVKSPGISPYRDDVQAALASGTRFIGGTALWFADHPGAHTLCITGTKGKSTSSALLAHLLRAEGLRTALAGNIGLPLLELHDATADAWVIELSSYQTGDVADSGVRPDIAVVLNVFPEHLDWHGSESRYVADKLRLVTDARPRIAILNAQDATLASLALHDSDIRWFGNRDGWHMRGDILHRGDRAIGDLHGVALRGHHNHDNLCGVLTAIEAFGIDGEHLVAHVATFQPLPHRLQLLGTRDGVDYVNDSISTTPHASLAALELHPGDDVAILVGGHDRGLDWSVFADRMRQHPPGVVITMGSNGPAIHALLAPIATHGRFVLHAAAGLAEAVAIARVQLSGNGTILLSPGAPSFGAYRDYTERGRHFAAVAGFDPDAITAIAGPGVSGPGIHDGVSRAR